MSKVRYHVTGKLYNSTRQFKRMSFQSLAWALSINLWRGSVWQVTDGKRKLLRRVYN